MNLSKQDDLVKNARFKLSYYIPVSSNSLLDARSIFPVEMTLRAWKKTLKPTHLGINQTPCWVISFTS